MWKDIILRNWVFEQVRFGCWLVEYQTKTRLKENQVNAGGPLKRSLKEFPESRAFIVI
jgi:hypothetical protein